MGEKSYVSLDTCIICGEAKGIVLDRRMRPRFERETITSIEPCEKCREKYLKEGVMLVHIGDNDYDLLVIRDEAFKGLFDSTPIPEEKIARCDKEVISKLKSWEEQSKEENK